MSTRNATMGLAAVVLALQACTTTYVGHKLPPDGSQPAGDTGVPYNLMRHEFTLKIAADSADATKAVYTLQRTSVPDPNQRYSLALDPAFLTDGTMTYSFGTAGNLGNVEASTTSQVVATVKAVAGFAANVIGASTALKDEAGVWTRFTQTLKSPDACRGEIGMGLASYESQLTDAATKKFPGLDKDAVFNDPKAKEAAERAVLNQRSAWVADRFHYRTTAEKTCLEAVQKALAGDEQTAAKDAYTSAVEAAEKVDANAAAVKELKGFVAEKREPGAVTTKLSALDDKANPALKSAYQKAEAYLTGVQNSKLAAKLAQFYVDMPLDVWRARQLAQVESDLEQSRFAAQVLLANPPKADGSRESRRRYGDDMERAQRQVKSQQDQRDNLVDASDLKQRIAAVDVLLNTGKTGHAEGRAQLSTDRDRLQGLWDQARADLLAKNQTFDLAPKAKAEKVQAKDDIPVALVDESYVKGVSDGSQKADETRKFVVVMRRLPSPTPMQQTVPGTSASK